MRRAQRRLASGGATRPSGDHPFQFERVLHRVARLVVIEINVDGAQLRAPAADLLRPRAELTRAVAALVLAAGSVQPDVSPVGGDDLRRLEAVEFKDAESGVMRAQQAVHIFVVPTRLAELEGVPVVPRESLEKRF